MIRTDAAPSVAAADPVARFGLLASAIAGRPLVVAAVDGPGWTDGTSVFVSATEEPRRQVIVMSALVGAGSLDRDIVTALNRHTNLTRRYLAIEGRRVLTALRDVLPRSVLPDPGPLPVGVDVDCPAASLRLAQSRVEVPAVPSWFGELRPARVDASAAEGSGDGEKSRSNRFGDHALARALQRLLGIEPEGGEGGDGEELKVSDTRMGALPKGTLVATDPGPPATVGLSAASGLYYPEWDEARQKYRPAHCQVVEFLPGAHELAPLDRSPGNDGLRRELGWLGLGPQRVRKQRMGYDLDLDAAVAAQIVLATGRTPSDTVYVDNLRSARELSVLVLLDASGSGEERTPAGQTVFAQQQTATAALVDTLNQLGDRVAAYAFRSEGRLVSFTRLKRFDDPFGQLTLQRIGGVQPGGLTRFGGAIRHATRLLCTEGGTARRLLVVISDGFPYDHGYEGRYAEGDSRKALDEARASGVGCLCLNLGSSTAPETLARIYARTEHATSESLDELTPTILQLFSGALRTAELRRRHPNHPDSQERPT